MHHFCLLLSPLHRLIAITIAIIFFLFLIILLSAIIIIILILIILTIIMYLGSNLALGSGLASGSASGWSRAGAIDEESVPARPACNRPRAGLPVRIPLPGPPVKGPGKAHS